MPGDPAAETATGTAAKAGIGGGRDRHGGGGRDRLTAAEATTGTAPEATTGTARGAKGKVRRAKGAKGTAEAAPEAAAGTAEASDRHRDARERHGRSRGGTADAAAATATVDAPAGTEIAAPDKPAEPAPRHRWRSLGRRPRAVTGAGAHARAERFSVASLFKLPGTHDPSPDNGQLIGISAWAMGLGVVGLLIALRGLVGIVSGHAPDWYEPALIGVGLVGILFTVLAFLAIQRRYLPWIMLALATIPLGVNIGLTVAAL